jgi:hypothetical protein
MKRGKLGRIKNVHLREWRKLTRSLDLKELPLLPNMKKLAQALKKSESWQVDIDNGKWEWSVPIKEKEDGE